MATYAIGDVQGCYSSLQQLTRTIRFNSQQDRLWFVGDLVNRGPESLQVLRYIKNLGSAAVTVLGNHDLFLLAVATGVTPLRRNDTLAQVLEAPDGDELLNWLRQQPNGFYPWFTIPLRRNATTTIVIGHWAAMGLHMTPNLLALDSGCVYGRQLTAVRLEDRKVFQVACKDSRARQ